MSVRSIDWRCALAVWRYNLTLFRKVWKLQVVPQAAQPLVMLLGMGLGLGASISRPTGGGSYLVFVAPGLMTWAMVNGTTSDVTFNMFVRIVYQKLYDGFLCTPCEGQDVAIGELMWAVTRGLMYSVAFFVLLVVLTATGTPALHGAGILAVIPALLLVGAVFALMGQLVTCFTQIIEVYHYYLQLFITPLFLLSGIFFRVEQFRILAAVVWFTPLYHGVRLIRGLTVSRFGQPELVSLIWLLVVAALLLWFVPRALRRRLVS